MSAFLLVDDHTVLRSGVARMLRASFPDAQVGEAVDGAEALRLLAAHAWDVMLLDIGLPGKTGIEVLQEVQIKWPTLPVLVLTGLADDAVAIRVFEVGAMGYLSKDCSEDDLIKAVRKLLEGGRYLTPSLAEKLAGNLSKPRTPANPEDAPPLKGRMLDVLIRLGQGDTVKAIAADMQLSIKTVSTYRTRVLERLQLKSNTDIVRYCLIRGLTQ
jgi:DNA-binding NarL/FixJ family response regulator